MMNNFSGEENKGKLGMAVLECAVVSSGGKTYTEGCYILEGDSCIILCAEAVFKDIERNIESDVWTNMNKIRIAADQ